MQLGVIGTGYVGLVTGTCLAEMGNEVLCMDINEEKVRSLRSGRITIYEPDLEPLFRRNLDAGRLHFTTSLEEVMQHAHVVFLALPTPEGEDGSADLSHVLQVAHDLGKLIHRYTVVVDKSTVPVGTAEKVYEVIALNARAEFDVVSNPEFLREGFAVEDFMRPDRVVIGTRSERARRIMEQLYEPFVRQGNPILVMDERSAEMTKYAANSYLATRITFMNEIANLCELLGCDVDQVRKGIGSDSRIGKRFLFPGIGYGGSCFPKDVKALVKAAQDAGYSLRILQSVMQVNERQRLILIEKMNEFFTRRGLPADNWQSLKVAIWGISFKPNTDDIREAPSLYIINELLKRHCTVSVYDPEALNNLRKVFGERITYCSDIYSVLHGAHALLILTEWSVFRTVDFERIGSLMAEKVIFDGRNLYNVDQVAEHGFYYCSIGRQVVAGDAVKRSVSQQ
ncbi:MAG: UDP-glucose/GDP-mannose dehydrogenase family protein [Chitinophagales bacterium]|nr:UDP-glucose/GDP-mannose dehydrogenase family protein [Chitinophagales bacterium]MDW8393075.1 UDP-glucose/GDP-mannose dehydrogenase family protein [Chitinophagales bacterium]